MSSMQSSFIAVNYLSTTIEATLEAILHKPRFNIQKTVTKSFRVMLQLQ